MLKAAEMGQRLMKGVSGELVLKKLRERPLSWEPYPDLILGFSGMHRALARADLRLPLAVRLFNTPNLANSGGI